MKLYMFKNDIFMHYTTYYTCSSNKITKNAKFCPFFMWEGFVTPIYYKKRVIRTKKPRGYLVLRIIAFVF